MSLFPDTPTHPLRQTKPAEGENGARFEYRGVLIWGSVKGTVCGFKLDGIPMGTDGFVGGLGSIGTAQGIIDSWLDAGELPAPYVATK
jgi:hypothetical protein